MSLIQKKITAPYRLKEGILWLRPPKDGDLRARKVVSRSKARPTGKYPSWKMQRMMQWESVHELHAFRLLDADPNIFQFVEQPLVVTYVLDGLEHKHYPDVMVKLRSAKELWEVKSEGEAQDPETVRRTELMATWLPTFGFRYRLVIAETLTFGAALANASELLHYGRRDIPIVERERVRRLLESVRPITWGAIRTGAIGPQGRAIASRLILEGALHFDRTKPLTNETVITGSGVLAEIRGQRD